MSPSRRRLIAVMSMATPFSVAWMAGPALLPGADLTLMHAALGVVIPYGVAGLTLGLAHGPATRLIDHRQRHVPRPERRRKSGAVR